MHNFQRLVYIGYSFIVQRYGTGIKDSVLRKDALLDVTLVGVDLLVRQRDPKQE